MPGLYTPQQQAGVMSFYDAPTKGPKIGPRLLLLSVVVLTVVVMIIDHFIA